MNKLKEQFNNIKLNNKKLYLIANSDNFENDDTFLDAIASSLDGGVDILRLTGTNKSAEQIIELGKKIKLLCAEYNATFIINDRADIAFILEADGLHLEQNSIDIKSARKILGENPIIGISTQTIEQAEQAVQNSADYIEINPFSMSQLSPDQHNYIKRVYENIHIPYFTAGNINFNNAAELVNAGAKKFAIEKTIINSDNPSESAKEFLKILP